MLCTQIRTINHVSSHLILCNNNILSRSWLLILWVGHFYKQRCPQCILRARNTEVICPWSHCKTWRNFLLLKLLCNLRTELTRCHGPIQNSAQTDRPIIQCDLKNCPVDFHIDFVSWTQWVLRTQKLRTSPVEHHRFPLFKPGVGISKTLYVYRVFGDIAIHNKIKHALPTARVSS